MESSSPGFATTMGDETTQQNLAFGSFWEYITPAKIHFMGHRLKRLMEKIVKRFCIISVIFSGLTACGTTDKKTDSMEGDNIQNPLPKKTGLVVIQSTCILEKDSRIIEVKKTELGGCELFYTKHGKTQLVTTENMGTRYCEEVKESLQSNLIKTGFSCQ